MVTYVQACPVGRFLWQHFYLLELLKSCSTQFSAQLVCSQLPMYRNRPSPLSYLNNEFALSSSLDHLQRQPDDLRFVISTMWHQILIVGLKTFKVNNYIKI